MKTAIPNINTVEHEICAEEEDPPGCTTKNIVEIPVISFPVNDFLNHTGSEVWNDWKWQYRNRISTVEELAKYIPLTEVEKTQINLVTIKYPFSITPHYLSLINPDDPDDPIRKQSVPSFDEIALSDMGEEDPLAEKEDSVVPGLVHRYPDRVLMVLTDLCPMLCRHCTRKREWQHGGWIRSMPQIETMLDYIRSNNEIRDVVISGGDPLTLSTMYLEKIISKLRRINHVEIIRIGSRFPVVLPQRIDKELCDMLSEYGPIWLNTHFNHYREITPESTAACDRLLRAGVPVNNQSVLLRGVNDSVEVMKRLCQSLLKIKVRPYYLFQCDEVQGTEHLRTSVETGISIIEGLRGHTSGLAVPSYVIDIPGGGGKVPIQPDYLLKRNNGKVVLRNYEGKIFQYRNPQPDKNRCQSVRITHPVTKSDRGKETGSIDEKTIHGAVDESRVVVQS